MPMFKSQSKFFLHISYFNLKKNIVKESKCNCWSCLVENIYMIMMSGYLAGLKYSEILNLS